MLLASMDNGTKLSEYGLQLREKQKVKRIWGSGVAVPALFSESRALEGSNRFRIIGITRTAS
jgi:hypothetical protein